MARLRELLANPRAAMQITPRDAMPRYFGLSRLGNIPSMDLDERREMQQRINEVRKKLEVRSHSRIENSRFWCVTRV